ncbi:MAG: NAD(P)-dependent oxidoreductase [Pseudomonadota bacterium]
MKRLLITGANGGLGSVCRARLGHLADTVRLAVRSKIADLAPHEELVVGDLSDPVAVDEMVAGCDGIVHMGGQSIEAPWEVIQSSNIDGMYNLYEAARAHGSPRILFASSNHAIGFYPQTTRIDADARTRPDGLYGVSKVFGEALASMYYDKFGIETACVRIGSCLPEPETHRMLSTWLSHDDFVRLVECVFRVPILGCPIVYGVSNNDASWWNNDQVSYLGWKPQDNSEAHRKRLDQQLGPPDPAAADAIYQGGTFATDRIHKTD